MSRRAPEDDLEPLPVDPSAFAPAPPAEVGLSTDPDDRPVPRRWRPGRRHIAAVAILSTIGIATAVATAIREPRDDPAADARALAAVWNRAEAVMGAADRASVRVRLLVPIGDVDTTFRALRAVRDEERVRLAGLVTRLDEIDSGHDDVARAHEAVVRALAVRERRARLVAAFYASRAEEPRDFTTVEQSVALTGRDVARALDALEERFPADDPPRTPDLGSPALQRALGRYGRVVDAPLGARLLVIADGRAVVLDPDADRVRPVPLPFGAVAFVTLHDGRIVVIDDDGSPRAIDVRGRRIEAGEPIGSGDPIPSTRPGAVWLVPGFPSGGDRTGAVAREVTTDGEILVESVSMPAGHIAVGATSAGLVVMEPRNEQQPTFGVWSPTGGAVRVLGTGWFVAAHGDTLVTSACGPNPLDCTLDVTDVRTGETRSVTPPSVAAWRYEQGAISPDGRWLAVASTSSEVDGGLLFVDLDTHRTQLVRVETQATDTPYGLVWDDRNRVFGLTPRNRAVWARPGDAELHEIRLQVAFEGPVRVDGLAVVPR